MIRLGRWSLAAGLAALRQHGMLGLTRHAGAELPPSSSKQMASAPSGRSHGRARHAVSAPRAAPTLLPAPARRLCNEVRYVSPATLATLDRASMAWSWRAVPHRDSPRLAALKAATAAALRLVEGRLPPLSAD